MPTVKPYGGLDLYGMLGGSSGGGTSSSGGGGAAGADMEAALRRIQGLTEGRANEIEADPYQKAVMDFLSGVVSGKDAPFTNEARNAMLAQQGRGTAAAEAAQMQQVREGLAASGGSIYDPAYQSAAREAMSQRQGRNLDAAGQIASQAGQANFNARMGGAGQLSSARNAQNALINQMKLAGAGYQAQQSRQVEAPQQAAPENDAMKQLLARLSQGQTQQAMPIQINQQQQTASTVPFRPVSGGYQTTSGTPQPGAQTAGRYSLTTDRDAYVKPVQRKQTDMWNPTSWF